MKPQAGIFTAKDLKELNDRYEASRVRARLDAKASKPFNRTTVENATQEQVQNALHKIAMRKRKGN